MTKILTSFGRSSRRVSIARLAQVFATVAFICAILSSTVQISRAQSGESPVPLPSPFTPIVDKANVIDAQTEEKLGSIYLNLKSRADTEFAVVTVDTTGDRDIFYYSLAVYRGWGIGSKTNDGFLLLVAVKDRKYYTQVGYHLEGDLTDGIVGQIQREQLVPEFKKGNYSQGIYNTVQAYVATLAERRGFSVEGIDQRYAYKAPTPSSGGIQARPGGISSSCCTLLIILGIIILVLSMSRGGRGGGGGCLNAFLLGSLLNSGRRGGWSSSGWGGGGFGGGSWGGGGGGFGGGFGGGSAGGGGAGGSW